MYYLTDAGTSAKLYWKLAEEQKYELSVVGVGDTLRMMEKGASVSLTAVQLNPDDIVEADDDVTPKSLVSISVSCASTPAKHTPGTSELIHVHLLVEGVGGCELSCTC